MKISIPVRIHASVSCETCDMLSLSLGPQDPRAWQESTPQGAAVVYVVEGVGILYVRDLRRERMRLLSLRPWLLIITAVVCVVRSLLGCSAATCVDHYHGA